MQQHVNASTLCVDRPQRGIAVVFPKRGQDNVRRTALHLGPPDDPTVVHLGVGTYTSMPWCLEGRILSAQPHQIQYDRRPHLVRHKDWKGSALRIIAKDLNFGYEPLAPNLHFWAGGESLTLEPLARHGLKRDWQQRDEVWAIPDEEKILAGDKHNCVAVLTSHDGKIVMRPAHRDEVVEFASGYAKKTMGNPGPISWALQSLEALGATQEQLVVCRDNQAILPGLLTRKQLVSLRL